MIRSHNSAKVNSHNDDHDVTTVHSDNLDRVCNVEKGKVSSQNMDSKEKT